MKICFVTHEYPPYILGGAGTYAHLLIKGLKELNVDVHVLTPGLKNVPKENITRINSPDIKYWGKLFFSHYNKKYIDFLDESHDFDVIHYNEPHIILQKSNKPIVSTFHSNRINNFKIRFFTHKRKTRDEYETLVKGIGGGVGDIMAAKKSDRIICPCNNLKMLIHKYCFVNNDLIQVIPNGIEIFKHKGKGLYENRYLEKNSLHGENYILYIGRLDPMKGIDYLILAFKKIKRKYPKMKLVIAGSGPSEIGLKVAAKSVQDVIFLGFVSKEEDKLSLYHNCLAVVLPSFSEAFPMVILEAMASGKPVIASSVGGIPDLVRNYENGFLIKPGRSQDIERSINALIENPGLREEMGKRNRMLIKKKYSYKRTAKLTLNTYNKLLKT